MGAQGDVPDHALTFQRLDVVQYAALNGLPKIGLLVDTVEKAKVDVVRFQGGELPVNGAFDGVQVGGPAVFSGGVVGPEVDLKIELFPHPGDGPSISGERGRIS